MRYYIKDGSTMVWDIETDNWSPYKERYRFETESHLNNAIENYYQASWNDDTFTVDLFLHNLWKDYGVQLVKRSGVAAVTWVVYNDNSEEALMFKMIWG